MSRSHKGMRNDHAPEFILALMILAAAAIIIWSLLLRYKRHEMRHKERMTAIEKGAELPADPPLKAPAPWSPRVYLLRGLIWLFSGVGLAIFLFALMVTNPGREQTLSNRLWQAQNLRHQGATEDEVKQYLNSKEPPERNGPPIGFALIGLIPAGVGLAYLIYYRGEEHRPSETT